MKILLKVFLIILLCSGVAYGAADVRISINGLSAANTQEVSYVAYFSSGYNQYIHTEDTFKKTVTDAASIMNSNGGNLYFLSVFYSRANDWNPALLVGDSFKFYISRPVAGTCGSATGAYTGATVTVGPIDLTTTNYLAKPNAFSAYPGDAAALITWEAVSGADSYYVYRRYYNNGSDWGPKTKDNNYAFYQYVGSTASNYYHDSSLTNGVKYFYIIFAQQGSMSKVSAHTDEIMVTPDATNAPTITLLNPSSGAAGVPVTITGTKLGLSQGSGNVYFNGTPALPGDIQNWNGSITVKVPTGATTGEVYVVNSSGEVSNGLPFTVTTPAIPDISTCNPPHYQGDTGTFVNVVGTNTHFTQGITTAQVTGTGVTLGTVEVTSTTAAKVYITTILTNATASSRDITLTSTTEVATGEGLFVVSAPAISNVSPISGIQGAVVYPVAVTGTGTHFNLVTTSVTFGGAGVTGEVTAASATSATIRVYIQTGAGTGARDIIMTTTGVAGGTETVTGASMFTVTSGTPGTLLSCTPNSGYQGDINIPVDVVGSGTHFQAGAGASTIAFSGAGVTGTLVSVTDPTHARFNVTITNGAAIGLRNATVTTGAYTETGSNLFTVNAPSFNSINPTSGYQGDTITGVQIVGTGTHFQTGPTSVNFGANITVNTVVASDATHLTCNIVISNSAATGARNVSVTTVGETVTGSSVFTVNAPSILSVNPNNGDQGATITSIAIVGTGTHFQNGVTNVSFGSNITVGSVTVTDATHLTCNSVVINALAATGARNVVITTGGEVVTGTGMFTVNVPGGGGGGIYRYEGSGGTMMAYPNPFDPNDAAHPLSMLFNAATGEAVDIYVFDANGRVIWQKKDVDPNLSNRIVTWDGNTSWGEVVENGLYLIRVVNQGKLVAKGKILVIKK